MTLTDMMNMCMDNGLIVVRDRPPYVQIFHFTEELGAKILISGNTVTITLPHPIYPEPAK